MNQPSSNLDIPPTNISPVDQGEPLDDHDSDDFHISELYGSDPSNNMDESMFLHEDLDLQEFQKESDMIIEYFLSSISPFDQEDDMIIIEDFCTSLEHLSFVESHELNIEACFDKKLTVFSHNPKSS